MKRDSEVQRHIARYTATIEKAQTASPSQSRPPPPRHADTDELRRVRSEIQREKMEILALESMLAELDGGASTPSQAPRSTPTERVSNPSPSRRTALVNRTPGTAVRTLAESRAGSRARLRASTKSPALSSSQREPASPARGVATPVRTPAQTASPRTPVHVSSPRTPSRAPTSAPSPFTQSLSQSTSQTPATRRLRRALDGTPRPALAQSVGYTPGRASAVDTPPRASPRSPHVTTPRRSPPKAAASPVHPAPAKPALVPAGTVPPSTPELERVAAQIWALFGENLRYVDTTCTAASFPETFRLLSVLECCGQDPATAQTTAPASASAAAPPSSSTASLSKDDGPLQPSAPLSVGTVMMAHVLLLLFRAPAPHTLTMPAIKTYTETWWRQRGQAVFSATAAAPALGTDAVQQLGLDTSEVDLGGDALGARAVYGLIAKKLLRIHRAGGAATIRFA